MTTTPRFIAILMALLVAFPAFAQTEVAQPGEIPALLTAPLLAPQETTPVVTGPVIGIDPTPPNAASEPQGRAGLNPVSIMEGAANAFPGIEGGLSGAINVVVLITVISLVPAVMIMCTCFIRFIIVLGLLKQALGTQMLPPSQVILALSLFMTIFVMSPTIDRIYDEAVVPYQNGEITNQIDMWAAARQPLRAFMFAQIEEADNWSSVFMLMNYQGIDTSAPETRTRESVDTMTLIPAYMLSELKIAFLMGFRIYLPFLVIDMVIASLLISMSMMMLPPVLISLPFKILLFILVDGWQLVVGSLMNSVAQVSASPAAPTAVSASATPTKPVTPYRTPAVTRSDQPLGLPVIWRASMLPRTVSANTAITRSAVAPA